MRDRKIANGLKSAARGALAGCVGTAVMDVRWYRRYRIGGGLAGPLAWEFGSEPASWEEASAPAKVGKLAAELLTHRPVAIARARTLTNLMHWTYGAAWGAQYGVYSERVPVAVVPSGLAFGALVWAGDYVLLPLLGIYKPIWRYSPRQLFDDLTAHLVYGVGTASFCLMWRSPPTPRT